MKFIDYLTGVQGQKIIADYRVDGEPIFFIYDK
jgi:tungstate transport system substrate-binding protein